MAGAVLEQRKAPAKNAEARLPNPTITLLWAPVALALVLAAFPLFLSDRGPKLYYSFLGWSAVLLTFAAALYVRVRQTGRTLTTSLVISRVHWVQLIMHSSIYAYWGWYWREVYHHIPLFVAQIVFMYALDMLVCWARRDTWILGFGPIPIVLSTNLFLWFKDETFYLQFLLIALAVVGKEFFRWQREGRSAHIFNPSSLPLFVFSVVLIATKATNMTWGIEISETLHRPPYIYFEIFLVGLVVQALFRVTLVTLFLCGGSLWAEPVVHRRYRRLQFYRFQHSCFCFPGATPSDNRSGNISAQKYREDDFRRSVRAGVFGITVS